jgi:hypothetical protein
MAEYRIEIAGWLPASLSVLGHSHWRVRQRVKAKDAAAIGRAHALIRPEIPVVRVPVALARDRKMFGRPARMPEDPQPIRRRVRLEVTLAKGVRSRDYDQFYKSVLDGLKHWGLIFDDSPKWCEPILPFPYFRGDENRTVIILEDIPPLKVMKRTRAKASVPR